VRILNGAHTSSVLAAYLGGVNTVREMMEDGLFGKFVRQAVFEEIVPALAMEETERRQYANAVLERFQNPFIQHELLSISLNSVSKWKVRVLPSVLDYLSNTGKLPSALAFSLAALIRFYKGQASGTGLSGERDGVPYAIRDDAPILDFFARCWQAFEVNRDAGEMVRAILANESLWGLDLTSLPGMTSAVAAGLQAIESGGMRHAVESILGHVTK
jgi:tagaturonate reductase